MCLTELTHESLCTLGCNGRRVCPVQRYISTRPMFIDVRELSAGAAGAQVTDATTAGIAVRDLGQLYKGLLAAVKEEALVMEQVFPSPRTALIIFLQRVFEQRVQVAPSPPLKPLIHSVSSGCQLSFSSTAPLPGEASPASTPHMTWSKKPNTFAGAEHALQFQN